MSETHSSESNGGLGLMFALGGVALLVFLLGFAVIYYLSYVQ